MSITQNQVEGILGQDVYASDNNRVGQVGQVFFDDTTGRPEWLTVKTGLFGTKESFVPLASASLQNDGVRVPFDKDMIKGAPQVDVDEGHLSQDEEAELYRYYGMDSGERLDPGQTTGEQGFSQGIAAGRQGDEGFADAAADTGLDPSRLGEEDRLAGRESTDLGTDEAMTRSEERLRVSTDTVDAGRARLRKYVVTEQQTVTVPVSHEEVSVEREPITDANRDTAMDGPSIAEAEHEVALTEEQVVVTKEAVPVERVRLTTDTVTEDQEVTEDVRKEQIESSVEGLDDPASTATTDREDPVQPPRI